MIPLGCGYASHWFGTRNASSVVSLAEAYNYGCPTKGGMFNAVLPRLTLRMMSVADFVPTIRFRVGVGGLDVGVDGALEFSHAFENAATNSLFSDASKPTLDKSKPRRRCRKKVEVKAWLFGEPIFDFLFLMGRGGDAVNVQMVGRGAVNGLQEFQTLMAVTFYALTNHFALRHIKRGKQRGRAVALVIMRPRSGAPYSKGWLAIATG